MKRHILNNRNRMTKAFVLFLFCLYCVLILMCSSQYAFADGFGADMSGAARILQTLTLCGGAVAIAFCGIRMAYGSQQEAERAKSTIIGIAIATGAIFALPYVIQATLSWASQNAWSPSNLK